MQINHVLKNSLCTRHYLIENNEIVNDSVSNAYLNAYLLSNFGIVVDKPKSLTKDMVRLVSDLFHLNIPKSFYTNPQDTKYFSREELLIEQFVAYFVGYGTETGRIELFAKDLPEYAVGDELKLRTFKIVSEAEAWSILIDIMNSYCAYTRPFSVDELMEFCELYEAGFYTTGTEIKCKDNIFRLLETDESFARFLDKKDIVKLSIQKFGDEASFKVTSKYREKTLKKEFAEIAKYIPYVKHCPMSKKQAKYFNKIVKMSGISHPKMTNAQSPDRRALKFMAEGDIVAAADIYAANGSMLERRIKMLLSRATLQEAIEILNRLPANNPIVLYQLLSTLSMDDASARTFTFFHNNMVKVHCETEYEATYRKSKLNEATRKFLAGVLLEKIKTYYSNLPKLGKIYVNDAFYKIGMPTNTSASGKGIDVLPTGSRVPCTGSAIRTFVHWEDAFDIDSSLIVVDKNDNLTAAGWFDYCNKRFGSDILFSGDITGCRGAEFFDIDLDALAKKGYKYVIQTFHGYSSRLNSGEIYAGYQNKTNLNTKAWDPKNIEMQFKVFGDSRGCIAFAIDIQSREIIILNQIVDSDERVVHPDGFKTIEKYLQHDYLQVSLGMIAACRGELVSDPAEADVVFDDLYIQQPSEDLPEGAVDAEQKIIRSWDLEKLVAFVNN
jgi:hypothetical protein